MNFDNPIWLVLLGVLAVAALGWKLVRYLSPEAKWERRRRRSNTPIATKGKQPSVKFSVHVDDDEGR
jgi:hypothetical protein